MKRALAWMAGAVGVAALGRLLARRRASERLPAPQPAAADAGDPAEELRRKLAVQRNDETVEEPAAEDSLDTRRLRVHAKAQEAIDAMRGGDDGA